MSKYETFLRISLFICGLFISYDMAFDSSLGLEFIIRIIGMAFFDWIFFYLAFVQKDE